MDFGFSIPTRGPLATTDGVVELAKRGEELGFSHIAIPDHIVIPRTIKAPYPYNPNRQMTGAALGDCLEQLTLMAFLAAVTRNIRLLSSVLVVPHRSPVHAAKTLATIDVLSGGRLTVGCGAGWMEEEFVALGVPPFAERGKVTDEYLRIFKELWTADNPTFAGDYARFGDLYFLPKPLQKPHPPLWIGGESPPALRRAAKLGDAWYPAGANPQFPLDTAERYRAAAAKLKEEAEQAGRDPEQIALAYWAIWPQDGKAVKLDNGERRCFSGSDQAIADDILKFKEIGVRHLLFNFQRTTLAETLDTAARFATDVLSLSGH
ncbi:MAG: TIGR03619 family F420-dependent LLM class oxidoreductase [Gammaproteobacteria bacterium]